MLAGSFPGSPDSRSSLSLSIAFSLCPPFFKQKASEKDQIGTSSPLTTIDKRPDFHMCVV